MRRADLIRTLGQTAKDKGVELVLVREGSKHTIYAVGSVTVSVPRHREINERTAQGILKKAEEG